MSESHIDGGLNFVHWFTVPVTIMAQTCTFYLSCTFRLNSLEKKKKKKKPGKK